MGRGSGPVRVLHVEDDERYASMAADRLAAAADLVVATAASVPAALEHLATEPVDCVLTDDGLPGADGLELLRRVRERDPELPVVVLSDRDSEAAASEAITAGATDYFRKDERGRGFELLANRLAAAGERYRSERRLAEERRRNDEFVRLVAHDLRNPMAVARGWVDVLHEEGGAVPHRKAVDALERMDAIVDNLERLARSGETEAAAEQVELSAVATAAWELVDTGGADLRVEYGPEVHADPSMLQQALENLFANAVEHGSGRPEYAGDAAEHGSGGASDDGPPGAGLTVRVGTTEEGFFVADDGVGVDPDDRERVFDSGYTADGGSGLGLAIVERIAEAHGWTVAVEESPAGGARFAFSGVAFERPASPFD